MKAFYQVVLLSFLCSFYCSTASAEAVLWVDVRSVIEHKIDRIEGDPRISHDDIVDEIAALKVDQNTTIRLYCRSGGRAGKAQAALKAAGYQKAENVGSIEQARELRGLTE